jgi:hypothetical protein
MAAATGGDMDGSVQQGGRRIGAQDIPDLARPVIAGVCRDRGRSAHTSSRAGRRAWHDRAEPSGVGARGSAAIASHDAGAAVSRCGGAGLGGDCVARRGRPGASRVGARDPGAR